MLKEKDLNVGEIVENFNMLKFSIFYYLDILKRVDLVISEKKG